MLTEKETWLKIGKAFEAHDHLGLADEGLCSAICMLYEDDQIDLIVKEKMTETVMSTVKIGTKYFPFMTEPFCPEGDAIRAKFCREQAALL